MEGFRIDLNTFLGLAMTFQLSECEYLAGFVEYFLGKNFLTFMIPI